MVITTIPHDQWKTFARQFGRQHRGWRVTIEAVDSRLADRHPQPSEPPGRLFVREGVLREVSVEEEGEVRRFRMVVGEGPDLLMHRTGRPLLVQFEATEAGAHQGLRIEDDAGTTTRLRFRTPADPEVIDGIGAAEW